MKKVFLPVSLALLAGLTVSCSTTEYKKYAGDEAKQVASILRENGCMDSIRQMLLFHSTVISPLSVQS